MIIQWLSAAVHLHYLIVKEWWLLTYKPIDTIDFEMMGMEKNGDNGNNSVECSNGSSEDYGGNSKDDDKMMMNVTFIFNLRFLNFRSSTNFLLLLWDFSSITMQYVITKFLDNCIVAILIFDSWFHINTIFKFKCVWFKSIQYSHWVGS